MIGRKPFSLRCFITVKNLTFAVIFAETAIAAAWAGDPVAAGNATIRAAAGESDIVIKTTSRLAGAIDSLTWNGREFIDSTDHGRQLQSASNFDAGSEISAETFNPTEAGSRRDGAGSVSSSRLLHIFVNDHRLQTTSQMAFWLAPGELSEGHVAKNSQVLSNHLLTKRVQIGYGKLAQVIQYDVTFSLPIGEPHRHGVFEAVTGYMPASFEMFWKFNVKKLEIEPLDDGPGEQSEPVILATASGSHAMGVYSPDQPSAGFEHVGYGRFRFKDAQVVKWNCVFRRQSSDGLSPGEYAFRNFVVVGDLKTVKESLKQLCLEFAKPHEK